MAPMPTVKMTELNGSDGSRPPNHADRVTPAHPGEYDAGVTKDRRIRGRTRDAQEGDSHELPGGGARGTKCDGQGCFQDRSRSGAFVGTPIYAASKAAINVMTVHFASLLPW
jgi:hypothetical protein